MAPEPGEPQTPAAAMEEDRRDITTHRKRPSKKRKQPSEELADAKPGQASVKPPPEHRYVCPIDQCTHSRSEARSLKLHYNNEHKDITDKANWSSQITIKMNYLEWLANDELATEIERKKFGYLLLKANQPALLPELAETVPITTDVASVVHPDDDLPNPQPAKRRKLTDLLEHHKDDIQKYIGHELKGAQERATKAEAKLKSLISQREAERAQHKTQMEELEDALKEKAEEIEQEKAFGSSTRLKLEYKRQAFVEAGRDRMPKHGGFMY